MGQSKSNKDPRLLVLATKGVTTNLLINRLVSYSFNPEVIIENKIKRQVLITRRIKKLGISRTSGQLAFLILLVPVLKLFSSHRLSAIVRKYDLDSSPTDAIKTYFIDSVNNESILGLIQTIKPELIILNGTRIMSPRILEQINIPIINIHAGITPQYRGVHGGYWSIYSRDSENFGVTIHFVDKGIDSGKIIRQIRVTPSEYDNFFTYPLLQFGSACSELKSIVNSILQGEIKNDPGTGKPVKGKLWYHPTLFQYMSARILRGVK